MYWKFSVALLKFHETYTDILQVYLYSGGEQLAEHLKLDHQITKYDFRKLSGHLITKSVHLAGLYFPQGMHQCYSLKDFAGAEVFKQTF